MGFIIHYDVAAMILIVTILVHYYCKKTLDTKPSKLFAIMLWVHLCATILDIGTALMIDNGQNLSMGTLYFWNSIYCIMCYGTTPIYLGYLIYTTKGLSNKWSVWDYLKVCGPIVLDIVFVVTTFFTKFVFYFESDGSYHHGPGFYILYGNAILYFILAVVQTYRYRTRLRQEQRITVYFYSLLNVAAVLVEMYSLYYLITRFIMSVSIMLIYFAVENPEDYKDKKLEIFNREGFVLGLNNALSRSKPFRLMGIHIEGLNYLNETIGEENRDMLLKEVVEFLCHIGGKRDVYVIGNAEFVIRFENDAFSEECLVQAIQKRFETPFPVGNMDVLLSAYMAVIRYPEDADTLDNMIDLLEYALNEAVAEKERRVVYANEDILKKKRRETQILHLMKKALHEKSFEVYYQPIFSVKEKRYTAAEALIRMPQTEIGFISPEEFIPIAEKNGLILEIGEFVFRTVCEFMVREQIWEKGIEHIHVNLSVVQCMQEKLAQNFLSIMDENHLPCKRISLEVTETAAVVSSECLSMNMNKLVEQGVQFALDDYGTGFSNATSLIEYPYQTIKIDKGVVWAAMENENAMKVLTHSVAMIKSLRMDIVAEGVETMEQAEQLCEMGCDYFQGYYYSKPVRQEEFVSLLNENCA